ncbi:RT RNaseH 2 domain-containing protein [Abeliophyllum distichum]|uniref:RT RNaseH 2 domain-containing protein n=1 Tax=Abeliophyllum distichum TaxID=126358 RepID=A0ABD1SZN4_9LAMI
MRPPSKYKEVQSLTGRVATLSRFISRATNKCFFFIQIIKAGKRFEWTKDCDAAFDELKKWKRSSPLQIKPKRKLGHISSNLIGSCELDAGKERGPAIVTNILCKQDISDLEIEKLALALVLASRKLRPYFQSNQIMIPRTDNSFVDVLSKLASSQDAELFKTVPVELLFSIFISEMASKTLWVEGMTHCIQEILDYLKEHNFPTERDKGPLKIY